MLEATASTRPVLQSIRGRASAAHGLIELIDPAGRAACVDSRQPLPAWFGDLSADDQLMVRHWLDRWAANAGRTASKGRHHE